MIKLNDKIVFITGASAGIGKACARVFAREGAKVIMTSRRKEKLDEIAEEINMETGADIFTASLDVRNREEVFGLFDSLPDEWKNIDILINNAGLALGLNKLQDDDPKNWDQVIDTNIKGALYCAHAALKGMIERNEGHIVNLGSIAGHEAYPKGSVYCATKHALDAITKSMRMDLIDKNIRVSTVDPGMVETEFSMTRFGGDEEKAANVYKGVEALTGEDIVDAILFIVTRPKHVTINEIIIMPSAQASPFVMHKEG